MTEDLYCFKRELDSDKRTMSVTGVLRRAGLVRFFVSKANLSRLAAEGRDVHLVFQDIAKRQPDYWSQHDWLKPYAVASQDFVDEFQFVPELTEQKIENKRFGYVGRLDQFGTVFTNTKRQQYALIEVKRTASEAKWHVLQTAAYAAALTELVTSRNNGHGIVRYAVYLRPDGTYKAQEHKDALDFSYFTAALTTARLRQAWGLVNDKDEREFDRLLVEEETGVQL